MMKTFVVAGGIVAALVSFGASAEAQDFYAAPIQKGPPRNLPGENLIPGVQQAVDVVNGFTQPILQPILAPDGASPAASAPAPAGHRAHHRHLASRHHSKPSHVASRRSHHKVASS